VPVEADGSAMFRVPANTPISVQPLDEEGKAIQLMRSWFTAMPGEVLSCVGCHERQNTTPGSTPTLASKKAPAEITPWYGPVRGFSFVHEVQPVLDAHCVRCHDDGAEGYTAKMPDLAPAAPVVSKYGGRFTPAYRNLYRYVRSHTMESDIHQLYPYEFHADSTRLVQMLQKGHHGVALSAEAWDRLITWIDLNTPAHGTWTDIVGHDKVDHQADRRRQMMARYAGIEDRPEQASTRAVLLGPILGHAQAGAAQDAQPGPRLSAPKPAHAGTRRTLEIGSGVKLSLVRAGHDVWMGETEVTNEQFAQFDASHDSRLEHGEFLQFSIQERGYNVNEPTQPVVRVSWDRAMAFCEWLSQKTGLHFTLPTEDQWEVSCRAGTQTSLWFGDVTDDFGTYANLADAAFKKVDNFAPWSLPSGAIEELRPAVSAVNDGYRVSAPVACFKPNAWGLYDMHGNVAEWTRSASSQGTHRKIVRGGSWYDRPEHAHSTFRLSYHQWMGVYDVGFRVVCEDPKVVADN
ncbi:MAG: formylglycine-generating enzyme family protein, partial [Planctomycetes bacterium]|nr:formylglycine-generating enzyme family protein [Planctomycetota bacterium]